MKDKVFEKAFRILIEKEGGYFNDPRGGETKYGISKKQYPHLDIKNLTLEQAKEIYYRDYWIPSKAYLMPEQLAILHFDTAVNTGIKTASIILQKALNKQGFNLKVDGIIGEKTLSAVKKADLNRLLADYTIERAKYYAQIGDTRFLRGWINRSISVYEIALNSSFLLFAGFLGLLIYIFKRGV